MENFIELTKWKPYGNEIGGIIKINIFKIESYVENFIVCDNNSYSVIESLKQIEQKIKQAKEPEYVTSGFLQTDDFTFVKGETTYSSDVTNKEQRTIFDLSYEEFRKLMVIATDDWYDIVLNEDIKIETISVNYTQTVEYKNSTIELRLRIYLSFDMALHQNGNLIMIDNQVQLHTKLNEMLTE
jgi:hypothetical protein